MWWVLRLHGVGLPLLALRGLDTSIEATAPVLGARIHAIEKEKRDAEFAAALTKVGAARLCIVRIRCWFYLIMRAPCGMCPGK